MSLTLDRESATPFDEDLLLIDRFLAGDEAAFERLYAKYYDKAHSIARGVLLDAEESADAVQEIFTLVYRNVRKFDRRSKFSTWLFRIAVNSSIQLARKNKFKSKLTDLSDAAAAVAPETSGGSDPFVDAAMAQLAPADRAILAMFYWDELSINEIAEALDCNANAAKTRLYRARERFREIYERGQ